VNIDSSSSSNDQSSLMVANMPAVERSSMHPNDNSMSPDKTTELIKEESSFQE
jgi:hypothetical protein